MKTDEPKSLGETIRAARSKTGLSLRDIALKVPINFVYLSEIEKDKNVPSEKVLQGLADIPELELDIDVLMALAGKIGENVFDYLKTRPTLGKIIREIAEADLDENELNQLQNQLRTQFFTDR